MAIYDYDDKPTNTYEPTIEVKEIPIYGGSRLGQYRTSYSTINVDGEPTRVKDNPNALGQRVYEFSNHLQNVLVVLADFKVPVGADEIATEFKAIVVSANDYYPFGMVMEGRKYYNEKYDYRYGFNGKEDDKDFGDKQLIQDYGFRLYNPAIARFLSVDPLAPSYPELTVYQFAHNIPIWMIDIDGLEGTPSTEASWASAQEVFVEEPIQAWRDITAWSYSSDRNMRAFMARNPIRETFSPVLRFVYNYNLIQLSIFTHNLGVTTSQNGSYTNDSNVRLFMANTLPDFFTRTLGFGSGGRGVEFRGGGIGGVSDLYLRKGSHFTNSIINFRDRDIQLIWALGNAIQGSSSVNYKYSHMSKNGKFNYNSAFGNSQYILGSAPNLLADVVVPYFQDTDYQDAQDYKLEKISDGVPQSIDGYSGPGGRYSHPTNQYLYYRWRTPVDDKNKADGKPVQFFYRYSDAEIESRKKNNPNP